MNPKEIIKKLFNIARNQQKIITQLANNQPKLTKQAGAGERVFIVLYVIPNSDHMVQGVFSTQELADAYLKSQSVRPEVTQRLLVKSYIIDANPVPESPAVAQR